MTPGADLFDIEAVTGWLGMLHGDSDGLIQICSTGDWSGRTITPDQIDTVGGPYVRHLHDQGRQGIYVRMTTLKGELEPGKRGSMSDSLTLPCLWADLDIAGPGHAPPKVAPGKPSELPPSEGAARQIIAASELPPPSMWIHSGGGLYPIWMLRQAHILNATLDSAQSFSESWHQLIARASASLGYHYGTGIHDLARVLRIPGTVNRKAGLERPCRIIEAGGPTYTLPELWAGLAEGQSAFPEPEQVSVVTSTPRNSYSPQELRPGDDFEARTDWMDLLGRHGWTLSHQIGRVRYAVRPGKDKGDGHSASIGLDSDRERMYVFSTETEFETQRPYTKFGAYAVLEHNGDHAAAAKALAALGYGEQRGQQSVVSSPLPETFPLQAPMTTQDGEVHVIPEEGLLAPLPRVHIHGLNGTGGARRLIDRFGDRLRWDRSAGMWLVYANGVWHINASDAAAGLVTLMLDRLIPEEAELHDDQSTMLRGRAGASPREKFVAWVAGMGNSRQIANILDCVKADARIEANVAEFDTDPMLLNCANGVVDLRTGELHPHGPHFMMTQQTQVPYRPDADAPTWLAFLSRVMPDTDTRNYLHRITGYSMTGSIKEQAFFIHEGVGANGKSVYLSVMGRVAGAYGQAMQSDTLLLRRNDRIPTDIARMVGRRFLQASETAVGRTFDEEAVKKLTGGENVTGRFLFKGEFDFRPTGKVHYVTNHLPRISGSPSIMRRIHYLKWGETIPAIEQDQGLADRIIASELPGVLAWVVRGCLEWQRLGLLPPASSLAHLEEYRESNDLIGSFLEDEVIKEEGTRCTSDELYKSYQHWCQETGVAHPLYRDTFVREVRARGFEAWRTKDKRGLVGLKPRQKWVAGLPMGNGYVTTYS